MKFEVRSSKFEVGSPNFETFRTVGIPWSAVASALAVLAGLTGCKVGPDYKRPPVNTPASYKTAASDTNHSIGPKSLGDLGWWEVFQDTQLSQYIDEALKNSWDVKIAAARVIQAEGALKLARSQFFPTINAGGDIFTTRVSQRGGVALPAGFDPRRDFGDLFLAMPAYEVDLWGRIRRANEAARAQLLASVDAQQTVRLTLVSEVATAYLDLLELDYSLEISYRTLEGRTNSLSLTISRQEGGVSAQQDVAQAKILVHTAEATIADIQRQREQQENALCILLARNPGSIQRGPGLLKQEVRTEVPAGLPSSLLEQRPDIRSAEQQLVAANANIGQAKAAFFPTVTLTGISGYQTVALSDMFSGPARMWQFGPAVTLPLFTGGRLRANLKITKAQYDEALYTYQQTVQNAFREVSDSLIAYQRES